MDPRESREGGGVQRDDELHQLLHHHQLALGREIRQRSRRAAGQPLTAAARLDHKRILDEEQRTPREHPRKAGERDQAHGEHARH